VIWLAVTWDWRFAFIVTGLMGVGMSVLWFCLYRNPEQHHRLIPIRKNQVVWHVDEIGLIGMSSNRGCQASV
jgi:predicted MFS family arabinose efflux permease